MRIDEQNVTTKRPFIKRPLVRNYYGDIVRIQNDMIDRNESVPETIPLRAKKHPNNYRRSLSNSQQSKKKKTKKKKEKKIFEMTI